MRLSDVRRLLDGDLHVDELRAQNAAALAEYAARGAEVGSVVRVPVTEDRDLTISRADVVCACELFRTGALRVEELAFIADVLQLSDRVDFEDSTVADHVAEFTDPKVNGPFTQERAAFIIKTLSRSTWRTD